MRIRLVHGLCMGIWTLGLTTLVTVVVLICAVSVRAQTAGPGTSSGVLEFKLGETRAVGSTPDRYEKRFAQLIEERTGGKIKITVFAGGSLGGEKEALEALRIGSMQMTVTALSLLPFLDACFGPYVFRDVDHAHKVYDGEIGRSWKERVLKESGGLRLIGWWYESARQLTTTKTAAKTPRDLKGLKVRVMESPIFLATWRALGANPVSMNGNEVPTALQQGTVDGQENPLEVAVSNKYFELQKYLNLTYHVRAFRAAFMSDAAWNKMSPDQQKIFMDTWAEVSKEYEKEYIATDQKNIDFLRSKGMTIVEADLGAYREASKDVWKGFMPKAWGEGVWEKVQAIK